MSLSVDLRGDQLAPHSVEAEEAVLGSCLIHSTALLEVLSFLTADDFFIVRHGWVYEAILRLHERREPIDYLTVVNEMDQAGHLAETGGAAYILSLINKTPSALNVMGYGQIVKRMAWRRRLIDMAQTAVRLAHSDETDVNRIYEQVSAGLSALGGGVMQTARTVQDLDAQMFDELSALMATPEGRPKVSTGFAILDKLLGSRFGAGTFTVIGAYTNQGKTQLAVQMASEIARQGLPVLYATLESVPEDIHRRMMAVETGIAESTLFDGRIDGGQLELVLKASAYHASLTVVIEALESVQDIESQAIEISIRCGMKPGIVFVDDVDSLAEYGRGGSDYERLKHVSTALLSLPLKTGWGVVALKQLLIPDTQGMTNSNKLYNALLPQIRSYEGGRTIVQKGGNVLAMLGGDWIRSKVYADFDHPELPEGIIKMRRLKSRYADSSAVTEGPLKWDASIPAFRDIVATTRVELSRELAGEILLPEDK